ncbi:MAG: glutathione S-transferase family protein [Rickettsiaceae bacterium]|nr:glutathione S-transferase family protein [Rickettsiaceae bacterium]
MKALYHYPLCPFSRQARIILKELDIHLTLVKEDFWLRRAEFMKLNPSGEVPVLTELSGSVICGIYPIVEYLSFRDQKLHLMDQDPNVAAEIRRLLFWFNDKFYREVTKWILDEKLIRLLKKAGSPRTDYIRAAKSNLVHHMNYLARLIESRSALVVEGKITFSDIALGAHLSVLDYFGEIHWDSYPIIKDWYSVMKSRPSFAPILQDVIPGFQPPAHYIDLDF